jgi:hypothetical protein
MIIPVPIIVVASFAMAALSMKKMGKQQVVMVMKKTYKDALMTGL